MSFIFNKHKAARTSDAPTGEDGEVAATPANRGGNTRNPRRCPCCGRPLEDEGLSDLPASALSSVMPAHAPSMSRVELVKLDDDARYPLDGPPIRIGTRPDNDVVLRDLYVSRNHAVVALREGQIVLENRRSANGTYLRIQGERYLQLGDEFIVGKQRFRVAIAGT